MSATVLYMSVSLDGFIAGPNEGPGNGLGDGGDRLHEWAMAGAAAGATGVPKLVAEGVNGQIANEFCPRARWSPGGRPSSWPTAGAATTTTGYRSSSTAAASPASTSAAGPWSPTSTTSRRR